MFGVGRSHFDPPSQVAILEMFMAVPVSQSQFPPKRLWLKMINKQFLLKSDPVSDIYNLVNGNDRGVVLGLMLVQ